jgi:Protein of unknown function (DUF3108)
VKALLVLATAAAMVQALPDRPVETPWGAIPRPVVEARDPSRGGPFGPADSLAPPAPPAPELPSMLPFAPGETLEFSIDYGILNAGHATMEVAGSRRISGHECFDIRTEAKSNSFFSKFYKVWDRAQTFVDPATLLPWRFEKHQQEGGYHKDLVIKFDRDECFARYEDGMEIVIPRGAQDELSAFYYLRTLPLEIGHDVLIDNHTNRNNYPLKVIVHGRETVEVPAGKFDCWVVEPVIRDGGIFTAKGTLTIWLTADQRRIPVKMRTKIVVGSVTASLTEYRLADEFPRPAPSATRP